MKNLKVVVAILLVSGIILAIAGLGGVFSFTSRSESALRVMSIFSLVMGIALCVCGVLINNKYKNK